MRNNLFRNVIITDKNPIVKQDLPKTSEQKPKSDLTRSDDQTILIRDLPFEDLTIKRVQVMYLSQKELEKLSISISNEESNNILQGTIHDPRMIPLDTKTQCSTCGLSRNYCPGHLGRVDLSDPIIKLPAYNYVIYVLQSVCHKCASLLISPDIIKESKFSSGTERLRQIALESIGRHCRNQNCQYFQSINPKMTTKQGTMTHVETDSGIIKVSKILEIFKSISDEDLEILGFKPDIYNTHPANFIFESLPIIPENNRPASLVNGKEQVDSLTKLYRQIVETNNRLKSIKFMGSKMVNSGDKKSEVTIDVLDSLVASLLNSNEEKNIYGLDNINTIKGRMSKKKGYIRGNAMGKRGNRTARSTLGSASLPFGFIRMPVEMVKFITVMERVCDKNFEYLKDLIRKGEVNCVSNQKEKYDPQQAKTRQLEIGNIVWRYLQNGDPIIFNRQPTLHKQSMMGYLVSLSDKKSIGLHSSNTTPHNADFDGDEGNIYVTPGYAARAEILYLAGCWNNIIGSQFSRPVMGIVYNGITSAYLLSVYGVFKDDVWEEGLRSIGKFRDRIERTGSYAGLLERASKFYSKDKLKCGPVLFSALLPQDFYYQKDKVKILNGILISGQLTKGHVGPTIGSIVHVLYNDYGTMVTARFISEAQFLLDWFIEKRGFSVGYKDCSVENQERVNIEKIIEDETLKSQEKIVGLGLPKPGMSDAELIFREESIQAALRNIKTIGDQIVERGLAVDNSLRIMSKSGAKGSVSNIAQITGVIGQQFFMGARPPLKINIDKYGNGKRFLPLYDVEPKDGIGNLKWRGFVDRSFNVGMRPGQYFAHMMDSRTGLIGTAIGTAATGHLNRIINKTLEDVRLGYNGTVCKENGGIVQYIFGPDSYDSGLLVKTFSPATGVMWSPINVSSIVAKLNSEVE